MTSERFSQQIQPLLEVQEIDARVSELRNKREEWPKKIAAKQTILDRLTERRDGLAEQKQQLEMDRDRLKLEVQEELERIRSYEKHINDIKTNREYQALAREVNVSKKAQSDAEEAQVEVEVELEKVSEELAGLEEEIAEVQSSLEEIQEEFDEIRGSIDQDIEGLEGERERYAKDLPRPVIQRYDLVRKQHERVVVPADEGLCTGCNRHLPPQVFNQVLRDEKLVTCPTCHRILLPPAPPEESQPEADAKATAQKG